MIEPTDAFVGVRFQIRFCGRPLYSQSIFFICISRAIQTISEMLEYGYIVYIYAILNK